MKRIIFLLLSLSIVILSNCNQSDELANRSQNIIQPTETVDPKFGVVIGRLLISSGNAHIPARNQILYLAELISSDYVNNEPSFAAFDRVNSPRTVTTEEGGLGLTVLSRVRMRLSLTLYQILIYWRNRELKSQSS